MKPLFEKRLKKFTTFLIAVGVLFLLNFTYIYIVMLPGRCTSDIVGFFGTLGRAPCSLVYAYHLTFLPLRLFTNVSNDEFVGLGLFFWFLETAIYTILFVG